MFFLSKFGKLNYIRVVIDSDMQKQVIRDKQSLAQVEEQQQVLKPLLQAEVRLLRMSQQEFEQDVRVQLDTNPALEEDDSDTADVAASEGDGLLDDNSGGLEAGEKSEYSKEDYDNERINDYSPDDIPTYYDPDRTRERVIADQTSFYESLKEQAASCNLTPKQERIMDYLIGSLDEDGFLRKSLRVLCDEMEIYDGVEATLQEVDEVVKILQTFEPVGVGAKDLQESLIIQLNNIDAANPVRDKAIEILTRGFDDYKNKRYNKLCDRFKIDRETLDRVYSLVRHLNPRPGGSMATADNVHCPCRLILSWRRWTEASISLLVMDIYPKLRSVRYIPTSSRLAQVPPLLSRRRCAGR